MWLSLGEYGGPRSVTAFLRYAEARALADAERQAFREYVCESLRSAPQGRFLTMSYRDIVNPRPRDDRSGDEIAADVIARLGLEVTE